jgi:phosphomevalonate decarboxylase
MKATAVAHPIQGLIKYHGLKDQRLRIPFHDSISVCIDALTTTTTIETSESLKKDSVTINGRKVAGNDLERVMAVLNKLRDMADYRGHFKVASQNTIAKGKGLGFSASGFAALGTATCAALNLDISYLGLSEIVRLGAGSATRSLAGSFSVWYADKNGHSYAEPLTDPNAVDLGMVIVPVSSPVKTDEAHAEVLSSPLFKARLKYVGEIVKKMEDAIRQGDVATIGKLAEEDSLVLHASTMTGKAHMVLWEPETIRVIRAVEKMRKEGLPVWYSMDTGPSVFVNTRTGYMERAANRLRKLGFSKVVTSKVGDKPVLTNKHLF